MPPLRLRNVNHISRVCANVAASKAFYENLLGFVEVVRPTELEDNVEGSWLFGYNVGIHLIEGTPVQRCSDIDPKSDHMSFQCDSFADVVNALEEEGIHYVQTQICHLSYIINQVFFHDPDNNMIEICTCECMPVTPLRSVQIDTFSAVKSDMVSGEAKLKTPNSSFLDLRTLDIIEENGDLSVTASPPPPAVLLAKCA